MKDFLDLIEDFRSSVFNFNVLIGVIAAIIVVIIEIRIPKKVIRE